MCRMPARVWTSRLQAEVGTHIHAQKPIAATAAPSPLPLQEFEKELKTELDDDEDKSKETPKN